ncbi:thiopurine S-methyltransferase [Nitrosomonas nitrosa]|uniref:thiopurine S-methyltransferase n=1 Tax=Nitrosomonas nitrosa TaxID=52442 RepID=UPI0023F89CA3|nr:thiopurine S-methyltransferase [Nitrosomonas nitrosa]MCO6432720.1 thiopurine S-methyltransferase [Nitrosomonas nitrosa]
MEDDYWISRWKQGEIGFHQDEVNPYLRQYWDTLHVAHGDKVFVPLCGKSRDMIWLHEQGHAVLGIELSEFAVHTFFKENDLVPQYVIRGQFNHYEADGITILQGNFFELGQADLKDVRAVYDRASMVALPPEMRKRYVHHLATILPSATKILLITFDYPQSEMAGPPYAVSPEEVQALYHDHAEIQLLAKLDVLEQNQRFRERGLSRIQEAIFLLTLR